METYQKNKLSTLAQDLGIMPEVLHIALKNIKYVSYKNVKALQDTFILGKPKSKFRDRILFLKKE